MGSQAPQLPSVDAPRAGQRPVSPPPPPPPAPRRTKQLVRLTYSEDYGDGEIFVNPTAVASLEPCKGKRGKPIVAIVFKAGGYCRIQDESPTGRWVVNEIQARLAEWSE